MAPDCVSAALRRVARLGDVGLVFLRVIVPRLLGSWGV
ncbi:hypothetical protein P3T40_002156 [Paraburkholderia sp. EB58]